MADHQLSKETSTETTIFPILAFVLYHLGRSMTFSTLSHHVNQDHRLPQPRCNGRLPRPGPTHPPTLPDPAHLPPSPPAPPQHSTAPPPPSSVPLSELVDRSDVIISILPPSAAVTLVHDVLGALPHRTSPTPPVYIDANAISPGTVSEISILLRPHRVPFMDGGVLGLPATDIRPEDLLVLGEGSGKGI